MLLADQLSRQGVDINVEKVIRISLLHDWAETRVGDMPRTAKMYFGKEVTRKAETGAFADIVTTLNDKSEYLDLYEDYESRMSLEARLVKAADVIDLLLQVLALEKAGARGLDEFWEIAEDPDFQLPGPAKEITNQLVLSLLDARRGLLQISRQ
jgi:putative hydrolase of HD superfamily